jgi:hypothetical protein
MTIYPETLTPEQQRRLNKIERELLDMAYQAEEETRTETVRKGKKIEWTHRCALGTPDERPHCWPSNASKRPIGFARTAQGWANLNRHTEPDQSARIKRAIRRRLGTLFDVWCGDP